MSSQGWRGQKLPMLLSKKTTKRGGGGQKLPILRQQSLWTASKKLWCGPHGFSEMQLSVCTWWPWIFIALRQWVKQFLWCCRVHVQFGWMNLKHLLHQRGFPTEGFPARDYFHVSSLNSEWVEIVSKATKMHNGLKRFLKAQFKAFKIVTR